MAVSLFMNNCWIANVTFVASTVNMKHVCVFEINSFDVTANVPFVAFTVNMKHVCAFEHERRCASK